MNLIDINTINFLTYLLLTSLVVFFALNAKADVETDTELRCLEANYIDKEGNLKTIQVCTNE